MAGTEPIVYRHDAAGRLVLTQDGEQRARGVTGFAFDDPYGRRAIEGEVLATAQLMDGVRNIRPYAMRTQTLSGRHAGYGVSLSLTQAVVDKAYYYDDYGFRSEACCAGIDSVLSASPLNVTRSNNRGLLTATLSRINSAADFDGSVTVGATAGNYIAETFGYDSRERVAESVSVDAQGVTVRENVSYSTSGLPITSVTQLFAPGGSAEKLALAYTYDDFERQTSVTTSVNDVGMARSITVYDGIGRTASVIMKDMRGENAETVSYSYITNGGVKSIATASGSMAMTLKYASGAVPSYSGNISAMEWKGADRVQRSYTYSYDGLNRLVSAQYAESGRTKRSYILQLSAPDFSCSYEYNLNGNPTSIVRKGLRVALGSATGTIRVKYEDVDRLTLDYQGNKITKVTDSALRSTYTGAPDFEDGDDSNVEYEYDANGNMTMDCNRGINGIVYNSLNLPVSVEFSDGSRIENLYDGDGTLKQRRLRQKAAASPSVGGSFPSDSIDNEGFYTQSADYCGPWEYVNGRLKCIRIPDGYIEGDSVYFHIADHQGNIRQVWNATTAMTVQDNHYYPYGAPFGESVSTLYVKTMARTGNTFNEISTDPYRYSAKEWQPAFGLNLYDFIARQYDPILCRFTSPDPLIFNYPQLSPYLYCAGNPVNLSDPTGLAVIYNKSGDYLGKTIEGFTGGIYIYSGTDENIDFSKYFESELESSELDILNLNISSLSLNTKLNIINHIITHFDGTLILDEKFEKSKMHGEQVWYSHQEDTNTFWYTSNYNYTKNTYIYPPIICFSNDFIGTYDATVENILSTVLVHEWYSHGIKHIGEENHVSAYENVIGCKDLWDKTTPRYQHFVLRKIHHFIEADCKRKLTESLYINLIKEYGK